MLHAEVLSWMDVSMQFGEPCLTEIRQSALTLLSMQACRRLILKNSKVCLFIGRSVCSFLFGFLALFSQNLSISLAEFPPRCSGLTSLRPFGKTLEKFAQIRVPANVDLMMFWKLLICAWTTLVQNDSGTQVGPRGKICSGPPPQFCGQHE